MEYQHEVLESQIEVQKQAFERIETELYDNVGQMLAVAKIYLCTLEESALDEEQQNYVKQINDIVGKTILDLRTLIRNLDAYLSTNFDLSSSLSTEILRIQKTTRVNIELQISGTRYSLGYEKEIVLFRIVQELINKLWSTGNVSNIKVILNYTPTLFSISIQFQGKNVKIEADNLHRRTELMGGKYVFINKKKKEILIELPVKN
ncbi:sensor histidine kinase [Runella salmonicolor]|uniref:Histidine kinase n=1 Tax=Runella salmonicolor TaxID=2950278 RepID=A0ABT1FIF3_9BACT|nr:histidine kinase [Runella salmonicolor]MCP1381547.1 histidine kinase [Runella salmonicolor]